MTAMVKKILSKYKFLICMNVGLLVFLLVMLWIKPVDNLRKYNIYSHPGQLETQLMPIYGNISVSQEFEVTDNVDSFEICIKPMNDLYHGNFFVRLTDERGEVVEEWNTDKLDIADEWIQYTLKDSGLIQGEEYRLEISAPSLDVNEAIGVPVFDSANKPSCIGKLVYTDMDDEIIEYADKVMSFGIYKKRLNIFAICALVSIFVAANIYGIYNDISSEWRSLPVLVASGFVMLFIMAPGSGPDEIFHYYSSFKLSNIILGRQNVLEVENKYRYDLPIHHNTNESFIKVYDELRYRTTGEPGTFTYEGVTDTLKQPVSHIAPALGMTIGRIVKMNFIQIYTLGRMFNLVMYIFLAWLAIKLTPVNKELMLIISIMPMTMHQAAQLSYDTVVNGLSLVLTAYVFKLLYDKMQIKVRDVVVLLTLLILLGPVKVIYFLLAMLILLIPGIQYRNLLDRLIKIGIIYAISLLSLFLTRGGDVTRVAQHSGKIEKYNMYFALSEPMRFAKLIIFNSEENIWIMVKGMIGSSLSGFSLAIPEYLTMGFLAVMILCAFSGQEKIIESKWQVIVIAALEIIGYLLVMLVFAFAETQYGSEYIGGIQGRYLIPFLTPFMYMLCGRKISIKLNRASLIVPIWFIEIGYITTTMHNIDF